MGLTIKTDNRGLLGMRRWLLWRGRPDDEDSLMLAECRGEKAVNLIADCMSGIPCLLEHADVLEAETAALKAALRRIVEHGTGAIPSAIGEDVGGLDGDCSDCVSMQAIARAALAATKGE